MRGFSGVSSWTPPLLHIHYITGSHYTSTWFILPFLCWWHTAVSLISIRWSNGSCTDLRLPAGHLGMDERTANPTLQHDFTIQLCSSTITPSSSVRNLGVIFDDQLTFKDHIAKIARSCRFALHNIRKIRPFLMEHAAQLLVQALVISRLDYCNALLAGLPSNTIKPLQMIQNAAARLVFNEPKRAHVTPLFVSLHLSLSRCTGYRLQLASGSKHWCLHIQQPQAQHPLTSTQSISPPEVWDLLVSDASWHHHKEPQNHFPEHSGQPDPG